MFCARRQVIALPAEKILSQLMRVMQSLLNRPPIPLRLYKDSLAYPESEGISLKQQLLAQFDLISQRFDQCRRPSQAPPRHDNTFQQPFLLLDTPFIRQRADGANVFFSSLQTSKFSPLADYETFPCGALRIEIFLVAYQKKHEESHTKKVVYDNQTLEKLRRFGSKTV